MVAVRMVKPPTPGTRETESHRRLRSAALQLAEANGFDAVTVDEIALMAGVSRRTFFRYFPVKEDALFSDHSGYLAVMETFLATTELDPYAAVVTALEHLVEGFLDDTNFVFRRDRIVRDTPSLVDRESLWFVEYQKVITAHLRSGTGAPADRRIATIASAALVAGVQSTLALWLAAPTTAPQPELRTLLKTIVTTIGQLDGQLDGRDGGGVVRDTVVISTRLTPLEIARLLEAAPEH